MAPATTRRYRYIAYNQDGTVQDICEIDVHQPRSAYKPRIAKKNMTSRWPDVRVVRQTVVANLPSWS